MFAFGENAGVGGFVECVAGVAICLDVDRTLKGARPSELPIEQRADHQPEDPEASNWMQGHLARMRE
jgi:hypothetical protein